MESQIRSLQEEVVGGNQLRKQQLVELGLLREEEKQKLEREQEEQVSKLRSQLEQQRLDLQKQHSLEMEKTLEKVNYFESRKPPLHCNLRHYRYFVNCLQRIN